MDGDILNLCKVEQMSICTTDTNEGQVDCGYFEKSQHANRCMYFIFDEYCDCLKAQMQAGSLG